jgi:hypothetical protein
VTAGVAGTDDEGFDDDWDPDWETGPADSEDRELVRRIMAQEASAPRWFVPTDAGTFEVLLPDHGRMLVARVAADLRDLLLTGDPSLQRLYPTAYPEDPERNQEFAEFAHDHLLMARLEGLDVVESSLDHDHVTEAELTAWMQVLNEARLVLGTRLDVTEDDERDADPDHPDAPALLVYHDLGLLLHDMVRALHTALPPPAPDGAGDIADD